MKLQVAFDVLPLEEALDLARGMEEDVDRFELGTPFLLEHGMEAVRRFRAQFPGKELLADTKIMDAGRLEAESAFRAGADLVTVLAVTDLATVRACVEAADRAGRRVVADMICVSDLSGRARELEEAGIHGIAVHTGVDQQAQGRTPLQDLAGLRRAVQRAELSAAGGSSLARLPDAGALGPDVIVIGGGILSAPDPVAQARAIRRAMPGPDGGILAEPRA